MDILQREGRYILPSNVSPILGVEFSGIISDIGPGVAGWSVGDQVLGLAGGVNTPQISHHLSHDVIQGAYAEYIAVASTHIIKKPASLSWVQAASIPEAFLTAYQALALIGKIQKGDHILIHAGASGVGIAAIQLARFFGAQTVIATTSTQTKIDWLLSIPGRPSRAVNYKTEDFSAIAKEVTDGQGVNMVIDCVGQSHFAKNIDVLAVDGRMVMLAMLSGSVVESVNLAPVLYKRLRLEGTTLRSRSTQYQADLIHEFTSNVFYHISGKEGHEPIKTYIHKVFPWEQIKEAHKEMEANLSIGKIVVEVV